MSVLALLLPLFAGSALVLAAIGWRHRGGTALVAGEGWVIGALLAGATTWLPGVVPAQVFAAGWPWLAGVAAAAMGLAWWLRRRGASADAAAPPGRRGLLWWLLLLLVLAHLLLAFRQAVLLPTVPWDAWTTWLGRARAWFGSEGFLPLVSADHWLQAEGAVRATLAPHYPTLLSRLVVWMASAAGAWDTGVVHLPWPALGAALAAGLYGHLRRAALAPVAAMAATFACVSLPLLSTHLSLAGYADLWVAALVLFAFLHWIHWRRGRQPGDLVLAMALAACLPLLKLEGAVWLSCLAAAAAWSLLPSRWQWILPLAAMLLAGLLMAVGMLALPLPGLGIVRLSWGEISIPALGTLELFWRPVGAQVFASLFLLPNWNLLWLAAPLLAALHWRALADRELRGAAAFLLLAGGFLFVLFFFTDASAWAENLTSINRLVLQVAPAVVAFLALLSAAERSGIPARRR